jgi:hypothetical protein
MESMGLPHMQVGLYRAFSWNAPRRLDYHVSGQNVAGDMFPWYKLGSPSTHWRIS